MKVTCSKCGFAGEIDDKKIPEAGTRVKCPKCQQAIFVKKEVQKVDDLPEKTIICPKCTHEQSLGLSCNKCGVIFSKAKDKVEDEKGKSTPPQQLKNPPKKPNKFPSALLLLPFLAIASFLLIGVTASNDIPDAAMPVENKNAVIAQIKTDALVKGAYINEDKNNVSLAVQVNAACNQKHAMEIGDNFLRLYIALSTQEEKKPGKTIGKTAYNYMVGIGTGPDNFIVQGAKAANADHIRW